MVKTLQDCCLAFIARNISSFHRLGSYLSRTHKELLLERICWHGLLTPEATPSISYHLFSHTLQRVNLAHSKQVDDGTLATLGRSFCLPISLTVHDCPAVTDKGIAALALIVRKTKELCLWKLKQVTGEGFKPIQSRSLKTISLRECSGITDAGVTSLVQNSPNVETLSLYELHKLTDTALVNTAKALGDKLVDLDCTELNQITARSTGALAKHCRNLRTVCFESCVRLNGTGLVEMAEHCSLSSLCLSFCYKVQAQQIEIIISLLRASGRLEQLQLMGTAVSPLGVEMIASTSTITHLSLCGVQGVTDKMIELVTTQAGETLLDLDISNCMELTDTSCLHIAKHCCCLESLGMRHLREIKGTALCGLFRGERAKSFSSIKLSGSKNIDSSVVLSIVTHCPNLETITMAGLKDITDDIALAVAHNCPNIQQISFRNCEISDVGVCEIATHCSKLQMIALAGIHCLTDKCVFALAENCPYISELYLSGCAKITKQAIVYLKDCVVGSVFVNHSTPSAPIGLLMAKDLDTGEFTRVDDIEFSTLLLKSKRF